MLLALACRARPKSLGPVFASLARCSHTFAPIHVPVVVVGAGPTGLVLSCLLSQYGMHSSNSRRAVPEARRGVRQHSETRRACRNSPHGAGTVTAADAAPAGALHQQQEHGGTAAISSVWHSITFNISCLHMFGTSTICEQQLQFNKSNPVPHLQCRGSHKFASLAAAAAGC
jgi:hypothetical protein